MTIYLVPDKDYNGGEPDRFDYEKQRQKILDKPKPCCACPETKRARDECVITKGEVNCKDLIAAHKECMKKMGFNI